MAPQTILFDMDDTLSHCNVYFDFVLDQFSDQLATWYASSRITVEEIKKKQFEIDTAGVTRLGFTADHFSYSLTETYRYFSHMTGRPPDDREIEELIKLGNSVYDKEVEPYPYMEETLLQLQDEGHHLYLYTGGVEVIQRRKVESLRLERFFGDRIFVRQRKETEALRLIIEENGFDRSVTWMVGNSLRTDILPALETGIKAVYVPAITEWEYNMVEVAKKPEGSFFTVPSLKDVPALIHGHLASAKAKQGNTVN